MLSQKPSLQIRAFAFLAGSLIAAATLSHAAEAQLPSSEPILVNVQVEAKPEPKKAVGMILSAGETVEIQDATIKKIGEKMYSISFLVDRALVRNDTVATAMVVGAAVRGRAPYRKIGARSPQTQQIAR